MSSKELNRAAMINERDLSMTDFYTMSTDVFGEIVCVQTGCRVCTRAQYCTGN